MEAPSKAFLLFFLFSGWLKLNHLKSPTECGFSDIFLRHFCFTLVETIGFTTTQQVLARKNVQKATFEATEMILSPWNQQDNQNNLDCLDSERNVWYTFVHFKAMRQESTSLNRTVVDKSYRLRLLSDGAICLVDCCEFTIKKAFRHKRASLNRNAADKSHSVIVA